MIPIKRNFKKVNVVIPMAGKGQRFLTQGYKTPKPLIEINGKPMIKYVIDCMTFPNAHFIFIIRKDHVDEYQIDKVLKKLVPDADIVVIDQMTQGAICTVLLAQKYFSNEEEVIIKDSDQVLNWVPEHFLDFMRRNHADGGIQTINTDNPGYSFAKVKGTAKVFETAEKVVISNFGATGCYYFAKGMDLIRYANQMIKKDIRTNNEFYVCPVYNEYIEDGKLILNYPIQEMYGLNTPEEFEREKHKVVELFESHDLRS